MTGSTRIAVLGAGSWGTALAIVLARNGHAPVLWGRNAGALARMQAERRNRPYLPDHAFPQALVATPEIEAALADAHHILVAVPSHAFRGVLEEACRHVRPVPRVVWAAKGFEPGTGRLLHEVAEDILPGESATAVLSGPTFAGEIAAGLPAAVTVASARPEFAGELALLFHSPRFRVYTSDDMVGVQAGGAVKNVFAIAAGIADGLGYGANTRAALIARGLGELMRLGVALGGRRETFMGLAGLGDLVLTCTDDQSRNRRFGLALATGASVEEAQRRVGQVVEGVGTCREVMRVVARLGVDMPICEQVQRVLTAGTSPAEAVDALLARAAGSE